MFKRSLAVCISVCALGSAMVSAAPPTPQEDEARIEELMLAESTAPPPPAAPMTPAAASLSADRTASDSPVIAAVAPPPSSGTEDWLVTHAKDEGLAFTELGSRIGSRVAIITTNEREHRGTIVAANAREVTLSVRRSGGNASYTLRKEQIRHIAPL